MSTLSGGGSAERNPVLYCACSALPTLSRPHRRGVGGGYRWRQVGGQQGTEMAHLSRQLQGVERVGA